MDIVRNKYAVHNADFLSPQDTEDQFTYFEDVFLDLFVAEDAEHRCDWFDEIDQAIAAHEKSFS